MATVTPTSNLPPLAGVIAAAPRVVVSGPEAVATAEAPVQAGLAPHSPADALAAAVRIAAARQEGLAPLLADLAAALKSPTLPPGLRAAIQTVMGQQLPTSPPPTAADLRQAVARSGLFLEARMAAGEAPPPGDFKTALASLGATLGAHVGEASASARAEPAPPPPYQDGPQQGQPPVAADLPSEAGLQAMVGHLQRRVAGAQARGLLQQAASATGRAAAGPWLFELPLATHQGAAVAQFQIDADQPAAGEVSAERTWRAHFTLDLEGVGPVHAHLALRGEDLMLGLFAEAPDTAARLDQDRARLATALQAEALNPQIAIRPGAPQPAPVAAGRFVDSAA